MSDRSKTFDTVTLERGGHDTADDGMCLLEAVAWLAGEPHTDRPACVSPVIAAFGRTWNDDLDDKTRQQLKPYAERLIGTVSTKAVEGVRAWMAADWLVRVYTPVWLRLAGLDSHAVALSALPELVPGTEMDEIRPVVDAAWDAAWAAARDAARDVAWAAARAAAWAAARAAARAAAGDAAWDAAWAAAWAAARAAAWGAAGDAIQPAVEECQQSAFRLLDRMINADPREATR